MSLGGEFDAVSGEEMEGHKKEILDALAGNRQKKTCFITRSMYGSGVVPAGSTSVLVELYPVGPSVGRIWNVTQLVTMGSDDHTSQAGVSVSWYLGDSANVSQAQCLYPAMPVPASHEFSKEVIWQTVNEQIFAVVYGAAAGAQFVFSARARDYPQDEIVEQRI
jgi:hypothetical protein